MPATARSLVTFPLESSPGSVVGGKFPYFVDMDGHTVLNRQERRASIVQRSASLRGEARPAMGVGAPLSRLAVGSSSASLGVRILTNSGAYPGGITE